MRDWVKVGTIRRPVDVAASKTSRLLRLFTAVNSLLSTRCPMTVSAPTDPRRALARPAPLPATFVVDRYRSGNVVISPDRRDVAKGGRSVIVLRRVIGDELRRRRQDQGRTLREVSSAARVSLGYLSEVERGQKEASSELLASICTALQVPLSTVMRSVSDEVAVLEGVAPVTDLPVVGTSVVAAA